MCFLEGGEDNHSLFSSCSPHSALPRTWAQGLARMLAGQSQMPQLVPSRGGGWGHGFNPGGLEGMVQCTAPVECLGALGSLWSWQCPGEEAAGPHGLTCCAGG